MTPVGAFIVIWVLCCTGSEDFLTVFWDDDVDADDAPWGCCDVWLEPELLLPLLSPTTWFELLVCDLESFVVLSEGPAGRGLFIIFDSDSWLSTNTN